MAKIIIGRVLKEMGISKYRFAKMLGERYSSVFRYFQKGYNPKFYTLAKWAKVLNRKISDLYKE